jgi:hypothetical protein
VGFESQIAEHPRFNSELMSSSLGLSNTMEESRDGPEWPVAEFHCLIVSIENTLNEGISNEINWSDVYRRFTAFDGPGACRFSIQHVSVIVMLQLFARFVSKI